MKYKMIKKYLTLFAAAAMLSSSLTTAAVTVSAETVTEAADSSSASDVTDESRTYTNDSDGGHAIEADGQEAAYSGITVTKTGEADGDEADFYGENAAVFATNGAALTIEESSVTTNGTHANGIFSYGEGTVVKVSDTVIETSGNCSGGLMVTGGGTLEAENLTIHTTGNSSAAIRSDRGGGTETVTGGSYTTDGTGSPVIYSTADVTVQDAELTSTASQGVVVEGKNSVTLQNVTLTADNNTKNSDKSDTYQAVMIYQSMSGDAAQGEASFAMEGGSLTNKNGDIFFVNNTVASIALSDAEIVNEDSEGVFLRAEAAGWGSEGSNGGHVTLTADGQKINGDMIVDAVSTLNLYLNSGSTFTGAVNPEGEAGEVYVELADDAVWTLTGDSWISSLTCGEDAIDLNGYTLYVGGEAYTEGTASEGAAIEVDVQTSGSGMGDRPDAPPAGDGSQAGGPSGQGGQRPDMPAGDGEGLPGMPPEGSMGERPEMPPEDAGSTQEMPSETTSELPEAPSDTDGSSGILPYAANPDYDAAGPFMPYGDMPYEDMREQNRPAVPYQNMNGRDAWEDWKQQDAGTDGSSGYGPGSKCCPRHARCRRGSSGTGSSEMSAPRRPGSARQSSSSGSSGSRQSSGSGSAGSRQSTGSGSGRQSSRTGTPFGSDTGETI